VGLAYLAATHNIVAVGGLAVPKENSDLMANEKKTTIRTPPVWFLLALSCLLPGFSSADADGPDFYRVVGVPKGDVLNLRSAPSAHADKVGQIHPGSSCVRNLGCQGGLSFKEYSTISDSERVRRIKQNPRWCHVEFRGQTGWVNGRYLVEGACP
jgi:uncharacterized protein YgiM (DUF1202 family)